MLSRTTLRQVAAQAPKLRLQGVRAASAWSQVAQGPPVSQQLHLLSCHHN